MNLYLSSVAICLVASRSSQALAPVTIRSAFARSFVNVSRGARSVDSVLPKSTAGSAEAGNTRSFATVSKYPWMSGEKKSAVLSNPSTPTVLTFGSVTGRFVCREETMSTTSKQDKLKIVIFYGSTRSGRMADRVGLYVKEQVEAQGMEPIILDPQELPVDTLKVPLHFYPKPELIPEWLKETNEKIKNADGFLVLSPEYNCGIPGALSNLIDHFPPSSYRHIPVGVITYSMGLMGGVRVNLALRPKLADIGMIAIPTTVIIPSVHNSFSAEGKCLDDKTGERISRVVEELDWYAQAIKHQKTVKTPLGGPVY